MQAARETLTKQAARAAYGWDRPQSWQNALALLQQAAEAGEPEADRQLALVTQAPLEKMLALPRVEKLSNIAAVGACRGFAPSGFSEWLIEHAADRLVAASVNDPGDGRVLKNSRTARDYAFRPHDRDLVLAIMQERAARLVRVPADFHEPPTVISYDVGQEFGMHVDFIDPRPATFQEELRILGQRIATVITYLNEDFDDAETVFPDAQVKFRGGTGDAIVFSNVLPDGSPDFNTRHCGLPPTRGRKWVLSQWIRAKPFPYRPEDLR